MNVRIIATLRSCSSRSTRKPCRNDIATSAAARPWRCDTANTASPWTSTSWFRILRATATFANCSATLQLELAREVRADQYGIRTQVRAGTSTIKFEIVFEARIDLAAPGDEDRICGIQALAPIDLAAEKLLANADRWPDDSVYSRDLIDLAMMQGDRPLLEASCVKAEAAYGNSIRSSLARAVDALQSRPGRLEECMRALSIGPVTKAQLWQAIRGMARRLLG